MLFVCKALMYGAGLPLAASLVTLIMSNTLCMVKGG